MRIEAVVLDTNVVVSAALSASGKPFAVLIWCGRRNLIATSDTMLAELASSFAKPRIAKRCSPRDIEVILSVLRRGCRIFTPAPMPPVCRDPADDMVLATALAARADAIVTGDEDLLVLDPFQGIRVVTPAAFLELAGA
jgi:putative PIN family toxin of toxin-antitoxin system